MSKRKQMPPDVMRELQGLPTKPEQNKPILQPEEIPQKVQSQATSLSKPPTSTGRKKRVTSKKRLMNRVTYEIGAELKGVIHE